MKRASASTACCRQQERQPRQCSGSLRAHHTSLMGPGAWTKSPSPARAAYELNRAMALALDRPEAQAAWQQGEDPLADAAADLELREAMAAGFDELRC
ncbi:MAG: hypothetical protein J0L65_07650 [Xanthomonadales bacterium]|nr:hypothetical protein [Xanthomonadales bacterium]